MSPRIIASIVFTLIIAVAALIYAPSIIQAKAESWKTRCGDDGHCEMFQRVNASEEENAPRLAEFAIGFPEALPNGRGVVILPLGILLQPGVALNIDDEASYTFQVNHCVDQGCFAYIDLNDTVVNQLKAGNEASFVFIAQNTKKFKIPMTLSGFSKAYDKVSKK